MAQCLTHQTPVVELPLPLFMATGGLDEAELFILAGLIIHALSHSRGKAETEAQTSRGPGGEWNPSEEPRLLFFPFFFLIWESAGVAPCSRPRCLPQRGGEGQLVYAGGRRTGALWPVNIILRNKRWARLRIQLTFTRVVLKFKRACFGSKHPFSRSHIGQRYEG